ncbi:hypothetical protein [Janthinobacterium sp. 75]|uniref:Acb2/Tad1 domain-containing protein n=1 Tax=Janthinobacterium sp. 75 TaxID=2135628 RepID=UPI0010638DF3|nr:hypothetical protein [Janthinobacterium sp. 75]TDY35112.1 hypothetical protein C8C89_2959 [Janthinobacterium sp. 75]
MENQHRKITGYRELSAEEIALMNEIKAKGEELRALVAKIGAVITPTPLQISVADVQPNGIVAAAFQAVENEGDTPLYWLRSADIGFRSALMYATRAVAQPTSY